MKKMPVILTFDIDGETLWRCRDPKNAERPVILSQGQYGPETAMPRILKLLRRHSVHATFFIPGFTAEEYPDMVRQIAAQGHDIGNHSWSHADLKSESDGGFQQEVGRTDALLRETLGEGDYWLRPPYGFLTAHQRQLLTVPAVKWSVDPEDWKLRNTEKDVAAVLQGVQPGDIILMHDTIPATVDAALRIVDALQAEGYTFVTVEELLALSGVEAQPGVFYCSAAATEG